MKKCLEGLLKNIDFRVKMVTLSLKGKELDAKMADSLGVAKDIDDIKPIDKQFIADFSKYIREAGEAAKKEATDAHKRKQGNLTDQEFTELDNRIMGEFRDVILQFRKSDDLVRFTRQQVQENPEVQPKGIKDDVGFLRSALTQVATRVHDKAAGQTRVANHLLDKAMSEAGMTKSAKFNKADVEKGIELYKNALKNGDEIYKFIGEATGKTKRDEQVKFLLEALEDGDIAADIKGVQPLRHIVIGLRNFDDWMHKQANKESAHFKFNKEHTLPMRLKLDKVRFKKQKWTKMVREEADVNTLLGEKVADPKTRTGSVTDAALKKRIDSAIEARWKAIISDGQVYIKSEYDPKTKAFADRSIQIVEQPKRIEYMQEFVDMEAGVIGGFVKHRNNMLRKTALVNILGPKPNRALHDIKSYLINVKAIDSDTATKAFDKIIPLFEGIMGKRSALTVTERNVVRGTSNLFSGLAGFSAIRNFTYDGTMHAGLVRAMITGENPLTSIGKAYWGFITHMWDGRPGKLGGKNTDHLRRVFEKQGITIEMTQNVMNQGLREAMDTLALRSDSTSFGDKTAYTYASWTEKFGSIAGKWSLADATNRAARTYNSVQIGQLFLDAKNKTFNQIDKKIQKRMRRLDIGPREWEVLRKLTKKKDTLVHDSKGTPVMLRVEYTKPQLDRLAKELNKELGGINYFDKTRGATRALEEGRVATLQRILSSYKLLHDDMLNQIVSLTSLKGGVLETEASSLLHALLNTAIGKFSNIAFSQWYDMHRAIYDSIGLNPNIVSSGAGLAPFRHRSYGAEYAAWMSGLMVSQAFGGAAYLVISDLAKGDTPRDVLSQDVLIRALTMNGFAGVYSWGYENFLHGDNRDISTPASAFIGPLKKIAFSGEADKAGEGLYDLVQRSVSPLNIWWARGVSQRLFKESLMERSKWQKRRMKEEDREDWMRKAVFGESE